MLLCLGIFKKNTSQMQLSLTLSGFAFSTTFFQQHFTDAAVTNVVMLRVFNKFFPWLWVATKLACCLEIAISSPAVRGVPCGICVAGSLFGPRFLHHLSGQNCALILSYLYNQQAESNSLPRDIWRFCWCSHGIYRFARRFREIDTPSVADDETSD